MKSQSIPRRLRTAMDKYPLSISKVLDCPSGTGVYLKHFGPGSVGLDLQDDCVEAGSKSGLDIRSCNLEQDSKWPVEEGSFDFIWCSNYFEHSLSPHHFLIKARKYLKPNGVILIPVPVLPSSNMIRVALEKISPVWKEVYAADHINFFTDYSARKTVEFAGFHDVKSFVASFPDRPFSIIAELFKPFWFSLLISAQKTENWNYPQKAHKTLIDGELVFKS